MSDSLPSSPSFGAHRASRSSSTSSHRPALSLDLSNLPALSQPSPPSNTLLITDLHDPRLFQTSSLATIRSHLESIAPLNSFSPLPSFRRIVCSFRTEADAIRVRKLLDAEALLATTIRPKTYFGEPTPLLDEEAPKLLQAPQLDKLFFISPPPSPPHGWVLRNEEPPNKEVHASDLAQALAKLKTDQAGRMDLDNTATATTTADDTLASPMSLSSDHRAASWPVTDAASVSRQRSRSSTLIYHPDDHGGSPNLPAVMVEDTSIDGDDGDELSPVELPVKKTPPKTALPPVELMV
ncbi:Calcipressin-domain-containing protein [Aspergillus ambiguus]|uniref:putative calcineurin binding protein n=1 Tax=Aspergillus ambiguus TaxID=176160 RepID=UPI003CCCCD90